MTSDGELLGRIKELVEHEHALRQSLEGGGDPVADDDRASLHAVETELDQCWDLLRQRRARTEFGQNPDDASVRPAGTVENYRQ
jgi:hypothetical protein